MELEDRLSFEWGKTILYKNDGVDLRLSYCILCFCFSFLLMMTYYSIIQKLATIFIFFGFIWIFLEFSRYKVH